MKKLVFLALLASVMLASYANENESAEAVKESNFEVKIGVDHPIVGKWEYVKTILPNGNEVIELIATEHFYSDGTLLYVNVWLNPIPVDEYSNTPEKIKNNLKSTIGSIATYTIEKGKEKDKLTFNIVNSTNIKKVGNLGSIDIKVDGDTFIYYPKHGAQWIFKRVSD